MSDCVFCDILSGDLSAHFVYQDDLVAAFMSLEQPNPYKALVISRAHIETVYNLSSELAAAIFTATVKIARVVRDVSKCDGMNLIQSNGEAGQQDVFHFHLHIVPRFPGDIITLEWDNTPAHPETLSQLARALREGMQEG